jgi:hypothetical protein
VTAYCEPYELNNGVYSIWIAKGYRYTSILREIEYRNTQSRTKIRINTQYINPKDYVIEHIDGIFYIKFIKANFEYALDSKDEIILTGDIEKYA